MTDRKDGSEQSGGDHQRDRASAAMEAGAEGCDPRGGVPARRLGGGDRGCGIVCLTVAGSGGEAARRERSKPLVDSFETWLREERKKLSPKGPLAKAIDYQFNHWAAFTRFLEDGRICLLSTGIELSVKVGFQFSPGGGGSAMSGISRAVDLQPFFLAGARAALEQAAG
jgi:hypothetical protein